MGYQVDEDMPAYYRHGDTVKMWNPDKNLGDEKLWDFFVTMNGKCKRKRVALSHDFWAINKDGGYLYSTIRSKGKL